MKVSVVKNILEANERIARENRAIFNENNLMVFNLMSSPGAGKTSLLEKTIDVLKDELRIGVIEGDIQSSQDAERIAEKGIPVVQINTGGACHLDGNMIRDTFAEFDFSQLDLLVVENVGNLVCPAEFQVGEDFKAMILSVTEGEDKPSKYPLMFRESKVLLINKIDLIPYLDCSLERFKEEALKVNPDLTVFEISCKTGEGLEAWCNWLKDQVKNQSITPRVGMNKRAKGTIEGIVQGVGFRPFIYQLARRYRLTGYVGNTSSGVDVEVEGPRERIQAFRQAVPSESPPLAQISAIIWEDIPPKRDHDFSIITSKVHSERTALISPDVCICPQCLSEMMDPLDRRYRYPFINCTNCGPRYTIIKDVPYDRAATTMKAFSMCPVCDEEYHNPDSRRFHAQPNACWDCGPLTSLHGNKGENVPCDDPVKKAIEFLTKGHILAIKGLGGFHLAVDATNHEAVVRLRRRKHREEKPLAIMVKDLETARQIARISPSETDLLTSRQRPIVLLKKRRSHGLSPQTAPRNRDIGIMLPYTPLHYLLMEGPYLALVMTSGNLSEEPIAIDNREAFQRLREYRRLFSGSQQGYPPQER